MDTVRNSRRQSPSPDKGAGAASGWLTENMPIDRQGEERSIGVKMDEALRKSA